MNGIAHIISIVMDICIGGLAYRLASNTSRSLTEVRIKQEQDSGRIAVLEEHVKHHD